MIKKLEVVHVVPFVMKSMVKLKYCIIATALTVSAPVVQHSIPVVTLEKIQSGFSREK